MLARTAGLGAVRLAAVEGPPGSGKTELAVHWAHRVAGRFLMAGCIATCTASIATGAPTRGVVLEEWLRTFGVPTVLIPDSLERRSELFRSMLADRQILLVLDDVADSEQVLPLLPATPGCMVVITSRVRLVGLQRHTGGLRIALGGLCPAESEALLHRVVSERVVAEPAAAVAITKSCGHLPQATRAVAAHAAVHPELSLADLAEDLARDGHRLDVLSPQDDPAPLRESFACSYADLDFETAELFRFLGLHPGREFSTAAAAALVGCSAAAARSRLMRLATVHLVTEAGDNQWRLLELLKLYALERTCLDDPPQRIQQARGRMLQWYLHSMAAAGAMLAAHHRRPALPTPTGLGSLLVAPSDREAALAWAEREAPTVVEAIVSAREDGLAAVAWQLAVVCAPYLQLRTRWALSMSAFTRGLQAACAASDLVGQAWCQHELGVTLTGMRRHREALEHLDDAVRLREQVGDQPGLAWSLCARAAGYAAVGRWQDAHDAYLRALTLFRDDDNDYGIGMALAGWASVACRTGHAADEVVRCMHKALEITTAVGAPDGQSLAHFYLAETHHARADTATAVRHVDAALELRRDTAVA